MIWYRHWLEIRGRLLIAAIGVLVIGVLFPLAVSDMTDSFAKTGRAVPPVGWLLAAQGAEPHVAGFLHGWFESWIAVVFPLLVAGSGIRTQNGRGGLHGSSYYTLALPVSRPRLVCTRYVAGVAASAAILALSLALDCVGLLVTGHPLALGPMSLTSLSATLVALPVLSLLGLVNLAGGEVWSTVAAVGLWTFSGFGPEARVVRLVLNPLFPSSLAVIAVSALFLGLSIGLARKKEF